MQHWAAIDLLGGRVVSLREGAPSSGKAWSIDARKAASRWAEEGADGLHVVDLDRALGSGTNGKEVREVLESTKIPVEVGGGIRTIEEALHWLEVGASRVVIGTMAYAEPDTMKRLVKEAGPGRVSVAVDFRRGRILTKGWRQENPLDPFRAVEGVARLGCKSAIITDAGRDGTSAGPDLEMLGRVRQATRLQLTVSGGIRSAEDIAKLEALGVDGVILGRALYEGTVLLRELRRR